MSYSFLEKDNLADAWHESKTYMRPLWESFDEFERLANNKPHPNIAPHLPKVTEGTLSSTIIKQPRRIIQQLPTGKVTSKEQPELAAVVDYVWQNQIIPNARTNGSVLQKAWASTSKALTYGSQPAYVFFTQHGDYFGADFRLPYARHVFLENGQLCAGDSNIIFMSDWYTPTQIQQLIDREVKLKKLAEERGEKYQSAYDLKALSNLKSEVKKKDAESQNPSERKTGDAGGIEIVRAFQRGVGAEFYAFAPALDNKVIHSKVNPDRRGKMPIVYQFHTVDMNSPLGRGAPEQSGAVQNMLDGMFQSFQYNQALLLSPPLKKWGDSIVEETIVLAPDAIIDMGGDPNSKLEAMTISTQAITSFPENFGLVKGVILTGANGSDTSISAESGNTGFSKTNAGVKQQQAILGVDDNYIRKQFEDWFEQVAETMLNIHFAENAGRKSFQVEGDALDKLSALYPELKENDGNMDVIYDRIQTEIHFEVDASTSAGDDDSEQVEILTGITEEVTSNPALLERIESEGYELKLGEAYLRKVIKSGVQDPEKIIHKLTEEELAEKQQQEMAMQQAQMQAEQPMQGVDEQPQPAPQDRETMMIQGMRQKGFSDEQIGTALGLFDQGATAEQVMQAVMGGN